MPVTTNQMLRVRLDQLIQAADNLTKAQADYKEAVDAFCSRSIPGGGNSYVRNGRRVEIVDRSFNNYRVTITPIQEVIDEA
jgi:hypothetical protein